MLVAFDLDLGARVLAEEDAVADLDFEGAQRTVLEDFAVTDGEDLALQGLLLRGVGDDDAPLGLLFLFHALYDDAVRQGPELHGEISLRRSWQLGCWHSTERSARQRRQDITAPPVVKGRRFRFPQAE